MGRISINEHLFDKEKLDHVKVIEAILGEEANLLCKTPIKIQNYKKLQFNEENINR